MFITKIYRLRLFGTGKATLQTTKLGNGLVLHNETNGIRLVLRQ
jgi:hypothetical protein